MKKIILITIVCFLIPRFVYAQEPDSNLSIEGTLWRTSVIRAMNLPDGLPHVASEVWMVGFYDDKVYVRSQGAGDIEPTTQDSTDCRYMDGPVISIWYNVNTPPEAPPGFLRLYLQLAIMQPTVGVGYLKANGFGFYTFPGDDRPKFSYIFLTGSMVKESDIWSP